MSDQGRVDLHHLDYTFTVGREMAGKVRIRLRFWASETWQDTEVIMEPRAAMDFFRQGLAATIAAHPDEPMGDLAGDVERMHRELNGG